MKHFVLMIFLWAFSSNSQASSYIAKGHSKIDLSGAFNSADSNESFSIWGSYKRFVSDKWALGGGLSLSGNEGNFLNGYGLTVSGDYYFLNMNTGALFLGADIVYNRNSFKTLENKQYTWSLYGSIQIGYDYFIAENIAVTPQLYYSTNLDAKKIENQKFVDGGGLSFSLTVFL